MLDAFAICQIIVLYVLIFADNLDYFVLGCLHVCREPSRLLFLACHVCLLRTKIIFVRIEIFVLIFAKLLAVFFVIVKPDGYPIPTRNPTGTGINFYL
jgi:hypothetical protein